jgi:multiple sugar transport system substrate-binding protein
VMAASKHQQAAAEFATWLNTSPAATAALASQGGIYPADIAAQATLAAGQPPAYFSNQSNFYSIAKTLAAGTSQVTWGPDVNVAYSEFTTAFGTAATSKGSFLTPLAQLQSTVFNDMKKSGFTVQSAG